MIKSECIVILNKLKNGIADSDDIYTLTLEFLTDKNKSQEINEFFNFIRLNSILLSAVIKYLIKYFVKKYQILRLMLNGKVILYYE